jgi:hypothetical protein
VSLRAELPLKAATTEELLLVFQDLQEKIKAANLNGMKDIEKLSPQEEELAEESKGGRYYDDDGEAKRGEASFLFVYRVSDEDRAKASAEAFQRAKKEAGRLAATAGAQLGSLRRLDDQTSGAAYDDDVRSSRNYYRLMQQGRLAQSADPEQAAREAIALQPGKVSLRVSISASFNLNTSPSK